MNLIKNYMHATGMEKGGQDDQFDLISKAQAGCIRSREQLIIQNTPLVASITSKYMFKTTPVFDFDDLFQVGVMGLMHSINKFDLDLGVQFSTYATIWVRSRIERFILDNRGAVKVPVYIAQVQSEYHRLRMSDTEETDDFYIKLLAFENSMSEAEIRSSLIASHHGYHKSLDQPVPGYEDEDMQVQIEDMTASHDIETNLTRIDLKILFGYLTKRERYILKMRLNNYTMRMIGNELDISHERVRQIIEQAMRKIRTMLKSQTRRKVNELQID